MREIQRNYREGRIIPTADHKFTEINGTAGILTTEVKKSSESSQILHSPRPSQRRLV
jgi:hypothetical protein